MHQCPWHLCGEIAYPLLHVLLDINDEVINMTTNASVSLAIVWRNILSVITCSAGHLFCSNKYDY
jgi:hypothetical protein